MKSFTQLMVKPLGDLRHLNQHCQTLKRLDKICKAHLPAPLNQHCHVANLREKTLVLYTDSSLMATRLRLLAPELKRRWIGDISVPTIDTVLVRVRPPEHQTTAPKFPVRLTQQAFDNADNAYNSGAKL